MVTINIQEFEGYDLDEFTEFLLSQNSNKFQIIFPKETVLFFTTNDEVAWEYAISAYIGQSLKDLSTSFEYDAPSMDRQGDFIFTIESNEIDQLAEFLTEASSVFGNSEIVEPINFPSEVSHYIENLPQSIACQDFVEIALEYHQEENEEDE